MDFLRLLSITQGMKKFCARPGCTESFFHGYTTPLEQPLCKKCGDEFNKIMEDHKQKGLMEGCMRPRKYLDIDIQRFMQTEKGESFIPTILADCDHVVYPFEVLHRKKIEVADDEDPDLKEEMQWELEWAEKMKECDAKWGARYTQFHDHPEFAAVFRKLLASCSPEVLVKIMKCAEFHATRHMVHHCLDCNNSDDGIELEHSLRDLGKIWLETVDVLSLTPVAVLESGSETDSDEADESSEDGNSLAKDDQ